MEHHLDITNAILIPYFNFAIFALAFVLFFRKSLVKMAQSKRDAYLSASKEAAAALEQAKQAFDEVKSRFDSLESELEAFKKASEESAREEATRIADETARVAKQIKEETSRLAVDAVERARIELRHEVVAAARALAETKLSTELDSAAKERILKSRIVDAAKMTVQ